LGMGAAMAQMVTQSMQPRPATPAAPETPAAGAPTNNVATPTTVAEIQALLDNLDNRLANGEITESTYDKLSGKWQARLNELLGK